MKKIFWLVSIVISFGMISCNSGSQHHSEPTKDISIIKYRRITGKVVNAADMKPVSGSLITFFNPIKNNSVGTAADSEGKFVLDSIPSSVTKITVINVSANKSKEVTLNEEDNIVVKMD
jgi:hypothetical protein